MPDFVEVAVVFALYLSILLGRDDNVYSGRERESNDFRCVIATIGQKFWASIPSIRCIASLQSARVPSVIIALTGIPDESTAR